MSNDKALGASVEPRALMNVMVPETPVRSPGIRLSITGHQATTDQLTVVISLRLSVAVFARLGKQALHQLLRSH